MAAKKTQKMEENGAGDGFEPPTFGLQIVQSKVEDV